MSALGITLLYTDEWQILLALAALGAITLLLAPHSVRRTQQFSSTWILFFFAGVLLLPAVMFVLLVVIALLIQWVKDRLGNGAGRQGWHLWAFGAETHIVAGLASRAVYGAINPDPAQLLSEVAIVAAIAAVLAYVTLSHLVAAIMALLSQNAVLPDTPLFSARDVLGDVVILCVGYVLAVLWKINPWLTLVGVAQVLLVYWVLEIPPLRTQAHTDEKTGLWNSRHFGTTFTAELNRARRLAHPLTIIMADLDLMRNTNNSFGHLAGDAVLTKIGQTIRQALREYDIAGRFGGDEFAIVLPETDAFEAHAIAERLRATVAGTRFEAPTTRAPIRATMSFGLASFPWGGSTTASLLHHADVALYRAKQSGRNRVEVFSEVTGEASVETAPELPGFPVGPAARAFSPAGRENLRAESAELESVPERGGERNGSPHRARAMSLVWTLLGLIVAYATLGAGAAALAGAVQAALPGESLYPLKIAYEAGHLTAAPSDFDRARLHLEYAGDRVDEISELVSAGSYATVKETVDEYLEHIDAAAQTLTALVQTDPSRAADLGSEHVASVSRSTNVLTAVLGKAPPEVKPDIARAVASSLSNLTIAQRDLDTATGLILGATPTPPINYKPTPTSVGTTVPGRVSTGTPPRMSRQTANPGTPQAAATRQQLLKQ